jgi:hypothetical protein
MASLLSWCCGAREKEKEEFCDVITTGSYVNRVSRNPTVRSLVDYVETDRNRMARR